MKTEVIVPAAGLGKRLKSRLPKALVPVGKKPLLVYALEVFEKSSLINSVTIAVPGKYISVFEKAVVRYRLSKVRKIVVGGATRRESVFAGLKALDRNTQAVLIHDAARPFVTEKMLKAAISALKKEKAAIIAVPVKSTIKVADKKDLVKETPKRETLWEVQTPQAFRKDVILEAHRRVKDKDPSDDALLVERLGVRVKIIPGDYKNIKITTQEDVILAENFLNHRK